MKKNIKWKFAIILVTIVLAIVFFLPNTPVFKNMPDFYKDTMPDKGITLGLDLQGGIHLVYEVEGDRATEVSIGRIASGVRRLLEKRKLEADVKVEGTKFIISKNFIEKCCDPHI